MKSTVKSIFAQLGYTLQKRGNALIGSEAADHIHRIEYYIKLMGIFGEQLPPGNTERFCKNLLKLRSQIGQDLIALVLTQFKRDGFFVEFGAADGISASNTYILETEFNWSGILAEPARGWHESLKSNRSCAISPLCVWKSTGELLKFKEVPHGFGTIKHFEGSDHWAETRSRGYTYDVSTISLIDLLEHFNAPSQIDYMSLDTEGSELEILRSFDFDKYTFRFISVEHNYTANRDLIHALLSRNGYSRISALDSKFDDWYVCPGAIDKTLCTFLLS